MQIRSGQSTTGSDGQDTITVEATVDGTDTVLTGTGNGPISAFFEALQAIGIDARLLDYTEHTMSEGASAQAASYIECAIDGKVLWGHRYRRQHHPRLAEGRRLGRQPRHPLIRGGPKGPGAAWSANPVHPSPRGGGGSAILRAVVTGGVLTAQRGCG